MISLLEKKLLWGYKMKQNSNAINDQFGLVNLANNNIEILDNFLESSDGFVRFVKTYGNETRKNVKHLIVEHLESDGKYYPMVLMYYNIEDNNHHTWINKVIGITPFNCYISPMCDYNVSEMAKKMKSKSVALTEDFRKFMIGQFGQEYVEQCLLFVKKSKDNKIEDCKKECEQKVALIKETAVNEVQKIKDAYQIILDEPIL